MKVRLVAEIDERVKKETQIYAIQNNTTIGDITEKALKNYIGFSDETNAEEENKVIID